jgi:hypothetical protein
VKILFLHGWNSTPGGVKPTYLKDHGQTETCMQSWKGGRTWKTGTMWGDGKEPIY